MDIESIKATSRIIIIALGITLYIVGWVWFFTHKDNYNSIFAEWWIILHGAFLGTALSVVIGFWICWSFT